MSDIAHLSSTTAAESACAPSFVALPETGDGSQGLSASRPFEMPLHRTGEYEDLEDLTVGLGQS